MTTEQDEHLKYWQELASQLKSGSPLIDALTAAAGEVTDAELRRAADSVIKAVNEGSALSAAMAQRESVFTRYVCALVRAGEAGGVLDVIAERIVKGLRDKTLGPDAQGPEGEHARYWRTLGLLLSSGVPILHTLDLVSEVVGWIELANATRAIGRAVRDGGDFATTMRQFPEVFSEPICAAVEMGEHEGELDRQCFRVADALEKDDLSPLRPSRSARVAAEMAEAQTGPAVRFVNQMIVEAVRQRASDIHVDPSEDGRGHVRLRVDGVLREIERPAKELFGKIVGRIKIMSALDVAERRLPQDGRFKGEIDGEHCDLRVSVVPVHFGERVVLRILRMEGIVMGLENLGLLEDDLAAVRRLCHLPSGLIVCNGPAGCGKTTLLYSMLMEVDREECCVMTVEDPVEYSFERIGQIQVDPRRGLTYARALRHILRQDPDVIMVGEIRDLTTAEACVTCALTGHLVLTTTHTNTSPELIRRLMDLGLEPFRLNASLAAAISLRLVRVLCPECKQQADPALHSIPPEAVEFVRNSGAKFYTGQGCEKCLGSGFHGRTAIYEILVMNDRIRQVVSEGANVGAVRDAARRAGMKTMLIDGMEKAARGITSIGEVIRTAPTG